jgi:hypothetical protein
MARSCDNWQGQDDLGGGGVSMFQVLDFSEYRSHNSIVCSKATDEPWKTIVLLA